MKLGINSQFVRQYQRSRNSFLVNNRFYRAASMNSVMKIPGPTKSRVVLLALCCGVTAAYAWLQRYYSIAEVVPRSELIVVSRINAASIVRVPHGNSALGTSQEHHVELLISEVLKGQTSATSMVVSIHYGLSPVVSGRFEDLDLRRFMTNYPEDAVVVMADPGSGKHAFITGDIRTNHIWLLHHVRPPGNDDSDMIGVKDPGDIQPMAKKAEVLTYLR
jgi:hypothetical protein